MALDKQQILNDLGNVMNQLQSADCGCIGKLFNQGQGQRQCMPSQGCGGCCRRGYGHPCCGEPYTMGEGMPAHGRPYMSYCNGNVPKMYADGYNYLNRTVMQPVIKEVYEDLKSLNTDNTVMNNALGAKMGLTPAAPTPTLPCDGNMNQNAHRVANMNANGQEIGRGHPMMQHMQDPQMLGHQMQGHQMQGHQTQGRQMQGHQMQGHQMQGRQMQIHQVQGRQMQGHPMVEGNLIAADQQMVGGHQMGGGQQMTGNPSALANFNKAFPGMAQSEAGSLSFNPMEIAMQMNPALAKEQASMGAPHNPMSDGGTNQAANPNAMQNRMPPVNMQGYQGQSAAPNQAASNQQYANSSAATGQQPNQAYAANPQNHLPCNYLPQGMNQHAHMGRMNANQGGQGGNYGQHTAGVSKFKNMFPGVMGGEINFDPMEIAIQMNPANKEAAAMSTMHKLMSTKPMQPHEAAMKPVLNGINASNYNLAPGNQEQQQPDQPTGQIPPNQQQYAKNQIPPYQQQHLAASQIPPNQQQLADNQIPPYQQQPTTNQIPSGQQQLTSYQIQPNQQQYVTKQPTQFQQPQHEMYTAVTDNRQVPQQRADELNTAHMMSLGYPSQMPRSSRSLYEKQPILPVDNGNIRFNTLGQPIEYVNSKKYRIPEHSLRLPQTLPPQRAPSRLRTNNKIKATISKTSLFARQAGQQGRIPSRAQLQQVYHQYKGSQSYTDQNIANVNGTRGQTTSDNRLAAAAAVVKRSPIPVERVGGDTIANTEADNYPVEGGYVVNQVGDVANKLPPGKLEPAPVEPTNKGNRKKNGLQDMVFTTYRQSAAWSFHGVKDHSPRYRL